MEVGEEIVYKNENGCHFELMSHLCDICIQP